MSSTKQARGLQAIRALARASSVLERSSPELSLAHYRVLSAIAAGDERASRIADRLALGKPAVSAAVESFRQRGLLERHEVDHDQRASALQLTPSGRELLDRVEAEMLSRLDGLCSKAEEPEALVSALVALGDAIDRVRAERRVARR